MRLSGPRKMCRLHAAAASGYSLGHDWLQPGRFRQVAGFRQSFPAGPDSHGPAAAIYLPAVPDDAMSSNGVIQYLPAADPPRLYSVGRNGVDNGGAFAFKSDGNIDHDAADSPFFLNGPRPAAPAH